MLTQFDEATARLLGLLQGEFPLVPRPFAALGERLGWDESRVLERVAELKDRARGGGVIRQISAIFDSRALGYQSCLVAAKVLADRIDQAAAAVSAHPGVSHNYARNHAYNLWYTVAVPPDSRLGLEGTVQVLHERSGATVTRLMPALRMFKIGVKFDVSGTSDTTARDDDAEPHRPATQVELSPRDKSVIRVLQQDLPIVARPFDEWSSRAGCETVDELLAAAGRFLQAGVMRRFSAVLRHRAAGFGANAMGARVVPADQLEQFGAFAARFTAVSHCYHRPTYEDWPYSIFTMTHGRTSAECEAVLAEISRESGITDYAALYSTHEYKKVRVRYFTDDIAAWEAAAQP